MRIPARRIPRVPSAPGPRGTEQTRVLVVDDDPQMLWYVRDALTGAGYAPVVTGDPEEWPASCVRKGPPWCCWT